MKRIDDYVQAKNLERHTTLLTQYNLVNEEIERLAKLTNLKDIRSKNTVTLAIISLVNYSNQIEELANVLIKRIGLEGSFVENMEIDFAGDWIITLQYFMVLAKINAEHIEKFQSTWMKMFGERVTI